MMQAYIINLSEESSLPLVQGDTYLVYFSGCNFNCPYCNSNELLEFRKEHLIEIRDLKKSIQPIIGEIRWMKFTGGEPTLQRQALIELAKFAKASGIKTILETNGSKPETIRSLIVSNLIDSVILDIKSPFDIEEFEKVTRSETFFKMTADIIEDINETIKLLKDSGIEVEARTLVVPSLMFRKEDILAIAKIVERNDFTWSLVPFYPEKVIHKNLKDISPPTERFIGTLKDLCIKNFPGIRFKEET